MKRIQLAILSVFVVISSFSQTPISQLIDHPALKHASVGVCVKDLETGGVIVLHNGDKSLTPASVIKLVTTATALEIFGADYRYTTLLALDATNPNRILVIGSGDPTLGSDVFGGNPYELLSDWTKKILEKNDKEKVWQIYVADELFGYDGISPEWTWIDMGNYYASGTYGISIFDNSYKIFFDTTDPNSCPKIIRTDPEMKSIRFTNFLKTNTSGRDNGYIYGIPFSNDRILRGDIPAGRRSFSIKGDIPDPGLLLGEQLADRLRRQGIHVDLVQTARIDYISRYCTRESMPYRIGEILDQRQSRMLSDIIRETNENSNNHFAEHLLRAIGRKSNPNIYSDPLKEGIDAVDKFWKQKGIDTQSLIMKDGSGLAPQNAVSPEFLCEVLRYMNNKSENKSAFFDSLPKAGLDGTLKSFLKGTKLEGKIAAKSGSIGGVQCYAGYLMDGRKKYVFAVMVNKFNDTRSEVRSVIEKFLLSL